MVAVRCCRTEGWRKGEIFLGDEAELGHGKEIAAKIEKPTP